MKNQLNNKKVWSFKGKITKSGITFRKNKPNSPNVQMNLTLFTTMIYPIYAGLTKVKNKPNQTQYKPKTNTIFYRNKLMQSIYLQGVMKINPYWGFGKTKPIKANNQSSACAIGIITNHLEGKPNSSSSSVCAFLLFCRVFILECRSRGSNFETCPEQEPALSFVEVSKDSNFQIRSLQNAKAANWNILLSNGNTKKTSIIDN